MTEILTIDLRTQIAVKGGVEFLRAETSAKVRTPFVLVRYALKGAEQMEGLRLDLDKRAFLDHFEDSSLEAMVATEAPTIAKIVVGFLHHRNRNGEECLTSDNESLTS